MAKIIPKVTSGQIVRVLKKSIRYICFANTHGTTEERKKKTSRKRAAWVAAVKALSRCPLPTLRLRPPPVTFSPLHTRTAISAFEQKRAVEVHFFWVNGLTTAFLP